MKKLTKWGAGLFMAIAMMFIAGQACAVELGLYETGLLVPKVVHGAVDCATGCDPCGTCTPGSSGLDTVVGMTCINPDGCDVYWTFFDCNSTHITDGNFEMTYNDYEGFSWAQESGLGLEGMEGYLVFTSADNCTNAVGTNDLAGNAFLVDTSSNDAVFIPVVPLDLADYLPGTLLNAMDECSIIQLTYGIPMGTTIDMRYWMDPQYSAVTTIVTWTVCDSSGRYTINMFNDEEECKSVNFDLPCAELNVIDPSTLVGRPADFLDGFLRWTIPMPPVVTCCPGDVNDAMVFTYVYSSAFGAAQTLLVGEQLP